MVIYSKGKNPRPPYLKDNSTCNLHFLLKHFFPLNLGWLFVKPNLKPLQDKLILKRQRSPKRTPLLVIRVIQHTHKYWKICFGINNHVNKGAIEIRIKA